jgi:hypothetical protein
MGKAARAQNFGDEPFQIFRRLRLHAGGDFLGKKFKKKVWHCLVSARSRTRCVESASELHLL